MKFGTDGIVAESQLGGMAVVVLLHVLIAYVLLHDAAGVAIAAIQAPVDVKIIERIKPPPPPDGPPPPPNVKAPPPPYIPVPEVTVMLPPQPAPTITRTAMETPAPMTTAMVPLPPIAADDPAGIVKGSMLIRNGCELLEYPWTEMRDRHQGSVFMLFLVDPEGRVLEAKLDRSSGFKKLDEAALSGISLCRFRPTLVDNVARTAWKKLEFVWHLGTY